MIANLGMYDMPAMQPVNDRFWQAIQTRLGYGPAGLNRDMDLWNIWHSPDLLLGQTCGLPYQARLHDRVAKIGTPDYGLPGCPPGYYRSALVVREDQAGKSARDFAGATLACNEEMSQSGWTAPMNHLCDLGADPGAIMFTGAHANSARMVAEGRADIAGIDALTWILMQRHDPVIRNLRVIGHTAPTPCLPYITATSNDPDALAAAISGAITDLAAEDRNALHIKRLVQIPTSDYLALRLPPRAPSAA